MSINATPFNPTFKLVGNLQEDQVLVYSTSEGAFVNAAGSGSGGSGSGIDSVSHTGSGNQLGSVTGSSLVLQTITAGTNVTITDSGNGLVISADLSETLQSGTNIGNGSAILSSIDGSGTFAFKSIASGAGLTIADDGETITLSSNIDTTQFVTKSNNLSDLSDVAIARANLGAISQADGDARYTRLNANATPTLDNTFSLGSSDFRYNDIYASTFHGTAVLADNLTISGSNNGDVLTWNGNTWVAAPQGAGQSNENPTPQTLVINGQTLSITGGNSITLPEPVQADNVIRTDAHSVPSLDRNWDIGSADLRFNDIYAETFHGTAVLASNLSIPGTQGDVLTFNGSTWTSGAPLQQQLEWDGNVLSITDGNSISLNLGNYVTTTDLTTAIDNIDHPYGDWNTLLNKPTIPTDVSDLTDTTNLLDQVTAFSGDYNDLTGAPTIPTDVSDLTDTTNLLDHVTAFSGDYNDLTNKPTISESFSGAYADLTGSPTDISEFTDTTNLLAESQVLSFSNNLISISNGNSVDLSEYANVDAQQITLDGTELTISGGNTIDLASLSTTVDLTQYATQDFVTNTINSLGDSDGQELTFNGTILSISSGSGNGNSVDLVSLVDAATDLTGYATEQWVDDKLAARLDADYQNLSIVDDKLLISNGNSIDLSSLGGGGGSAQTLSIIGNEITISGGNSITVPVFTDVDNYIKLDGHSAPSIDNEWDIGSAELRFNDIYGERFHGTAVLADNITVDGDIGDVLTYNGNAWVASAPTGGSGGGGGNGVPQSLALDGTLLTISSGNTVDLVALSGNIDGLTSNSGTSTLTLDAGWNFVPATDALQSLGSATKRWTDIYMDDSTINIGSNTLEADSDSDLVWNGNKLAKLSDIPAPQTFTYDHATRLLDVSDGQAVDLTELSVVPITDNPPASPKPGELWLDALNLSLNINYEIGGIPMWIELNPQASAPDYQQLTLDGTQLSIANGNTIDLSGLGGGSATTFSEAYNAGDWDFNLIPKTTAAFDIGSPDKLVRHLYISGNSIFIGDAGNTLRSTGTSLFYNDKDLQNYDELINKPSIPQDLSDLTDSTGIIQAANTDSQSLTLVGSSLQISGGNSVDLSGISGASTWADLTGTPTTLAGYGITDGGSGAWADLTGTPTTLAGYGITDGGSGAWADITGTPTTLAGYGITDGGSGAWADITGTPTTLAGYGITDAPEDISDLTDTDGLLGGGATLLGDLTNVSSVAASTGQVLKWNGSSWAPASDSTSSGGSGISLSDLSVSNATANGNTAQLEYNNITGTFTLTPAVARTTIDDLDDVTITSTADGQVLTYNNTSGDWENQDIPGVFIGDVEPTNIVPGELWFDDSNLGLYINYDIGLGFATWLQLNPPAFSGDYDDLSNKPVVPADVNQLTDADGLLGGGGGGGIALSDLSVTNQAIGNASGSLQYSAQTGVFTFIPPDISSETRASVSVNTVTKSGGGSLTFNSSDGVFTYAPADMASAEITPEGNNGSIQYNDNGSLGGVAGFTYDSSGAGALIIGPAGGGKIKTNYWVGADNASQPMVIQSDNGSGSKATHIAFTNSSGSQTTTFSGTVDFTGNTINGLELTDLSINDGTSGQVLTTDGSGNFSFSTVSGGGGGVSSYNDLTDKPTIPNDVSQLGDSNGLLAHNVYTAGTGISVDNLVVSIDSNLGDLNNVSSSAPALGQLLAWSGTQWQPTAPAAANLSSSSIGELNNVDITGVQTGQFLEWDGSKFVPASGGTVDLSTESLGDLGNVDATVPTNGDVLTWDATSSEWAPAAPASGGGGGGGSTTEYFKLNYATNGSLSSISNSTSGVSANIVDVNSGEVAVTFSGYSFPPSNVLVYGYSRTTNQYIIMPLNKDMTTRTLNAGGSPGSPIAFGSLGSLTMNLVLREADTGAGRSFGTDTHAWIVVSMI
jgi:hypothetical protein